MTTPIYRYHAVQKDGWRFNFSTNPMLGQGWIFDGVAFHVPNAGTHGAVPLYQFHYDQSKTYGGWRFNFNRTMQPANEGWTCDGVAFQVFAQQKDQTVPIYQYHCAQTDGWRFHFSTDANMTAGWTKDGIAFYAYKGDVKWSPKLYSLIFHIENINIKSI